MKLAKGKFLVFGTSLLILFFSVSANAYDSSPIQNETKHIEESITITYPGTYPYELGAIHVDGDYHVTASENTTITININNPVNTAYAVKALNGGTISLDQLIVTIQQSGYMVNGMLADGEGSSITIGDYSKIDLSSKDLAFAVAASNKSTITIGNYAELYGVTRGFGTVHSTLGAVINIGSNAKITNIAQMSPTAIKAVENGTINVGSESHIEVNSVAVHCIAVVAGILGHEGTGTITLGDKITVKSTGVFSIYGLYSWSEGSSIKTGEGVKITVEASSAYSGNAGVSAVKGASISLGSENQVKTIGNEVYGITAQGINNSGATVTLGENNVVITGDQDSDTGKGSHGLWFENGGFIGLGSGTTVTTYGEDADAMRFTSSLFKDNSNPDPFVYSRVILTSKKGNLISNYTEETLKITFAGDSKLYGSVAGYDAGSNVNMFLKDASVWEGIAVGTGDSKISLSIADTALWIVTEDSYISSLNTKDLESSVKFNSAEDNFITLTVGSLSGSGTINMSVAANTDNPKKDYLIAEEATGSHRLIVTGTSSGMDEIDIIEVASGNANFYLKNGKADIGAYQYILGSRNDGSTYWFLKLDEELNPIVKNVTAGSIGMIQAVKTMDTSISVEGIKKKEGFFTTLYYKNQSFGKFQVTQNSEGIDIPGYTQNTFGLIAGYNVEVRNLLGGIFLGSSTTKQSFDDDSSANVNIFTAGLQMNAEVIGIDIYGYVRLGFYNQKYSIVDSSLDTREGTISTIGFSSSLMLSKQIGLFDDKFYITPKAKILYSYVSEHEFVIGDDFEFHAYPENGIQTWLGASVGQNIYFKNGMALNYHLDAAWIYEMSSSVVIKISDEIFNIDVGSHMLYLGVGVDFQVENAFFNYLSLDVNFAKSQGMTENIGIQLESSWKF